MAQEITTGKIMLKWLEWTLYLIQKYISKKLKKK